MAGQDETLGFRRVLTRAARLRAAVSISAMIFTPPVLLVLAVMCLRVAQASKPVEGISAATPVQLDVSDDGKQLKVLVRHPEIGPVCELWCYERARSTTGEGPSEKMAGSSLYTPQGDDRRDYLHPKGTRPHFDGHSGRRSARRIEKGQSGGTVYAILALRGFQTSRHSCGVRGALFHLHDARTCGKDR